MRAATAGQDAITSAHRLYERIDAQDVAGVVGLFADVAVYRRPGYEPIRGKAALERFYRQERVIREGTHTGIRVVARDSDIAVQGRFQGVLKDGREVELEFAEFLTVDEGGLFTSRTTFYFAPLV